MTAFDPTKPVRTRGGQPARIICTDRRQHGYKIVALVGQFEETVVSYTEKGTDGVVHLNSHANTGRSLDLVNVPEKHKGWVNISHAAVDQEGVRYIRHGNIWPTRQLAKDGFGSGNLVACIEVEFEEGQGLE